MKRKSVDGPGQKDGSEEQCKCVKEDDQVERLVRNNATGHGTAAQDLDETQKLMTRMQVSDPHVDP